ncbi:MAG: CopG family transcriptional regulator [Spirochaetes bacterium]|jgi:putative iron-only hydrogenase system regulator|nr:CopG family transcriptional regulator [Spirochaetota bacterium]
MTESNPHQEKRYGFVGIVVETRHRRGKQVQEVLSRFADLIQGRMGLPHLEDDRISVITLIVHADADEVGALTGRLGSIEGVTVKSGMAKL